MSERAAEIVNGVEFPGMFTSEANDALRAEMLVLVDAIISERLVAPSQVREKVGLIITAFQTCN